MDSTPFQIYNYEELVLKKGRPYRSHIEARSDTVMSLSRVLLALGYQPHGNERMYNGFTGRMMEGLIFLGPTFYQRLKHMVDDKIHSRARGPV